MNVEVVVPFTLGMLFYHGAISGSAERTTKVVSILAMVFMYHRAFVKKNCIEGFIAVLPTKNKTFFGSMFMLIGLLMTIESLIMFMVSKFLPEMLVCAFERAGGIFVSLGLFFLFSSVWVLSMIPDIATCIFIDQGIYAYVRHPYYLSLILLFVGCCFIMMDLVTVCVAYYILKDKFLDLICAEETFITRRHKSYQSYRQRVYSGVPFVWMQKEKDTFYSDSESEEVSVKD
ncbi:hypothetical protein NECID01_1070 [Nematocida sp. AWRm77]|nr:hypothetical protein NECID01_1070 [Nematocida sp. AWRm77]